LRNRLKNVACSSTDSLTLRMPTWRSCVLRTHLASADWTTLVRSRLRAARSRCGEGVWKGCETK